MPWLLERTLQSTLQERLQLDTRVESIRFNPFTFTLQIHELNVHESDGTRLAGLSGLLVNFELSSLFRWALSFDELHINRPHLAVELTPGSNNFATLAQRWQASAGDTVETAETDTSESSLLRLYIGDLQLTGGGLTFTDHRRPEPFSIELGPIDLAVADLSTLPESSGTQQVAIRSEEGTEISWTGTLSLNPMRSEGRVTLLGAYSPIVYRYLKEQLPFALDGGAADLRLHYLFTSQGQGGIDLTLDEINGSLTGLVVSEHDGTPIARIGRYEMTDGTLRWPKNSVRIDTLSFTDIELDVVRREDASLNLVPQITAAEQTPESADLEPVAATTPDPAASAQTSEPWDIAIDRIVLNLSRLAFRDESVQDAAFEATVDLALSGITNQPDTPIGIETRVQLASGGTLSVNGSATVLPEVDLELAIDAADIALTPAQPYLSEFANVGIEGGTIELKGTLRSGTVGPFRYQGAFALKDLILNDQIREEVLLSISSLGVDELQVDPGGLEVSRLQIDTPYARIEIAQDGSSNIQRTLVEQPDSTGVEAAVDAAAVADTAETAQSRTTAEAAAFAVAVGSIGISDASARFTDLNLPLPFEASIAGLTGKVSAMSSRSRTPAELEFEGRVNDWGQVTVSGALQPWAPKELTAIDVKFRNVDLPAVSPYTIKFAGREIATGRTDLDLTYALQNGNVTGANRLVIRDLTLGEKVEHPEAMSLPLDLAVALLKNSDGVIDLDIPVKGSLDDPEFSYGGAVLSVFGNLIVKLVASPFRLLGALVGMESEDFGAVAFASGRSDLSPPEQEKVLKLAAALTQRPELKLAVPGQAVQPADGLALVRREIEKEIDARLAALADKARQPADGALLSERRQQVIESLYLEAGIAPAPDELRNSFLHTDEAGEQSFDGLAYSAAMTRALIDSRPADTTALNALADDRASAVVLALLDAGIGEDRVSRSESRVVESGKPAAIELEVVAN